MNDMKSYILLVLFALAAGCIRTTPVAAPENRSTPVTNEPTFSPVPRYVEKGVLDLSTTVSNAVCDSIRLISATCDQRPTWHDGAPIYSVHIQFTKQGQYHAVFLKRNPDKPPSKHTLVFRVGPATSGVRNVVIDVFQKPNERIVVSADQDVVLTWPGIGGRLPAGARLSTWGLNRIGPEQTE